MNNLNNFQVVKNQKNVEKKREEIPNMKDILSKMENNYNSVYKPESPKKEDFKDNILGGNFASILNENQTEKISTMSSENTTQNNNLMPLLSMLLGKKTDLSGLLSGKASLDNNFLIKELTKNGNPMLKELLNLMPNLLKSNKKAQKTSNEENKTNYIDMEHLVKTSEYKIED